MDWYRRAVVNENYKSEINWRMRDVQCPVANTPRTARPKSIASTERTCATLNATEL